jgi:16S rRNA (guanine(1405)-N(7))-methyltransferase
MSAPDPAQLEALVAAVQAGANYRTVSPDLIRRIGLRALATQPDFKATVKATKNKLHQVAGAYLDARMRYTDWLQTLEAAHATSDAAFRAACLQIMAHHASTRERLTLLPDFYMTLLGALPPIHSVLDVACGLNPLALPWMPLAEGATYYACDLFTDLAEFLNSFFKIAGVAGRAEVADVIGSPPPYIVDVALVLKVLPPLEQVDKTAGLSLLRSLHARHILVSFPRQSLGGRDRRMSENYTRRFREMIRDEHWSVQSFDFSTELCFLLIPA